MECHEQKARDLFEKFYGYVWQKHVSTRKYKIEGMSKEAAKWCATQAVNEVISNIDSEITYHPESKALLINKNFWLRVLDSLKTI